MTIAPAERVETSLEELAALDFEPEVPCEMYEGCSARALWWSVAPCCSDHTPSCDSCRLRFLDNARSASASGVKPRHLLCGERVDATGVRFEPLRRT